VVAVSGFGSWLKNTKRQPSREICAPPQTIVSTGSQISVPCVSCSTAWIRLRESPRDSSIVHRDHETATKRSADSFVREFRDFRSRGHGCPRSWQRFTERLDARVRGNDLRKFEERPGGTSREIARRFYAGNAVDAIRVPKGRLNEPADTLRQPSLRDLSRRGRLPSVETLGYCRLSLRDRSATRPAEAGTPKHHMLHFAATAVSLRFCCSSHSLAYFRNV